MRAFIVILVQPVVQVGLQRLHGFIEFFSKACSEKFIEQGAVKPLDKAVGPGIAHLGVAMFDIVKIKKDLIHVDHGPAFVLSAIVGQDGFNGQFVFLVKWQNPVIENIHGCFRTLAGVQFGKPEAAIGVHHRLQVDAANGMASSTCATGSVPGVSKAASIIIVIMECRLNLRMICGVSIPNFERKNDSIGSSNTRAAPNITLIIIEKYSFTAKLFSICELPN